MAAEELHKIHVIEKLSNQALQEYEGLQKRHETAAMECKRLEEERDEAIKKLNEFQQVSQMVIEEVSAIQEDLVIERTCRESAEALATKMKQMEDRLRSCEAQRELTALRRKLELVEEEKREYSNKCSKAEVEVKDLRSTVEELQKKLQAATNPPPAPAPPPPPPPPPPPAPAPASNPLSALLSLIRKRTDISTDIPLVVQDSSKTPEVDIRQQAVEEMMHRIKKGVQLRPVSQSPNRTRRQMERLPSNSAIQELKGIMENFSSASPQPKAASPSTSGDEQLQRILLRRRGALESQHPASLHPILSPAV